MSGSSRPAGYGRPAPAACGRPARAAGWQFVTRAKPAIGRDHRARLLLSLLFAALLAGCQGLPPPAPPRFADRPVALASLPGWPGETADSLGSALAAQCALPRPPQPWPALCADFERARATGLKAWLEQGFEAWPMLGREARVEGLVTGYYEPILTGSLVREHDRQVPVYGRPPDLLRLDGDRRARMVDGRQTAYYTRAEIETGQILRGQELLWIDDPVEAFFLQVQGSGRVRLRDGRMMRVAFVDTNGHAYVPIGRVMRERGLLPADGVNAPAIKAWLRANPQAAAEIMQANPRYVFFRLLPDSQPERGPTGSLNVPLTPMRSIASDPRIIPPGALVYLSTRHPGTGGALDRVVVSQDTGAAIVGPIRADLFWGNGAQAELNAGLMQSPGRFWLLWPKGLPLPQPQ